MSLVAGTTCCADQRVVAQNQASPLRAHQHRTKPPDCMHTSTEPSFPLACKLAHSRLRHTASHHHLNPASRLCAHQHKTHAPHECTPAQEPASRLHAHQHRTQLPLPVGAHQHRIPLTSRLRAHQHKPLLCSLLCAAQNPAAGLVHTGTEPRFPLVCTPTQIRAFLLCAHQHETQLPDCVHTNTEPSFLLACTPAQNPAEFRASGLCAHQLRTQQPTCVHTSTETQLLASVHI